MVFLADVADVADVAVVSNVAIVIIVREAVDKSLTTDNILPL